MTLSKYKGFEIAIQKEIEFYNSIVLNNYGGKLMTRTQYKNNHIVLPL